MRIFRANKEYKVKRVKTRTNFIAIFMSFIACLYMACSDDDSSSSSSDDTSSGEVSDSEDGTNDDSSGSDAETVEANSSCDTAGEFAWVEQGTTYAICEDGVWVSYEVGSVEYETGFETCKFNYGAAWQASSSTQEHYDGLDYIAVWLGDNAYYNSGFEGKMLEMCLTISATPMIYAYVIAEFGKDMGLVDCDVADDSTHCTHGAEIIRNYFQDSILYRYQKYAYGFRKRLLEDYEEAYVDTFKTIWLIEPDYYQYSVSGSEQKLAYDSIEQVNGGIPDSLMGVYFAQIVDTIKTYLPGAKIAIDISPWIEEPEAWYANFDLDLVDYGSTSGGRTLPGSTKIRSSNDMTWAGIAELLNRPIMADAGYDAGGAGTGHASAWDVPANINARIEDGVIGVMQMDAALDYPARVDTIKPQITATIPWCE